MNDRTTFLRRFPADPGVRRLGAGLLGGLYLGRLLLEFAPPPSVSMTIPGFALAAVSGMVGVLVLARLTRAAWPALWLLVYLLYAGISPEAAGTAGALALATWLVTAPLPSGRGWDVAIFLVGLAVYVSTAAPGLLPADEGEFQLTVHQPGIAHPPGYPLYIMTGWAFVQLPLGDPAYRVNLFSALTAALALAVVGRAVRRETGAAPAGFAAALTLGAATSFWATAAQASIRPMTALFVALLLDALLAYKRASRRGEAPLLQGSDERNEGTRRVALTRFALCLGLGITHHASIVFVAAVFIVALLAVDVGRRSRPRRWLRPGVALVVGFLPWLYLPLRAAAIDTAELGADPATWDGFWQHVLARGFSGDLFYFHTPDELLARLRTLGNVLVFQWHGLVLAAAGVAALVMLWRARWMLFTLGGAFALHTAVTATYRAPQTVEYMVPAYVCLAVAVGWLVGELQRWQRSPRLQPWANLRPAKLAAGLSRRNIVIRSCLPSILASLVILGGVLTAAANRPGMVHQHNAFASEGGDARAFAQRLLDETPEDAALLANWHWVTPLRYLQRVEGQRPDVEVVYVYPAGAEPLDKTWARRVAEYLSAGRPVVVQSYYADAYAATGYDFEPQVYGPGWVVRGEPRRSLPPGFPPLDVPFEGGLSLAGGPVVNAPGGYLPTTVTLAWRVDQSPGRDVTSFIHVVDAPGRVVRQDDVLLRTASAQAGDIILVRYMLDRPPADCDLLVGLYAADPVGDIEPLPAQDGRARVAIGRTDAPPPSPLTPVTEHSRYDVFEDDLILIGYDYDLSLPGRARFYLHWAYRGDDWADFDLTLSVGDDVLGEARLRAAPNDHFTTAHDLLPDVDRVYLVLEAAGCGCVSRVLGPFGLAKGYGVDLPGPRPGDRYVPLGSSVVLTDVGVDTLSTLAPGAEVDVTLRFRATYPLAEDDVVKVDLIEDGWAWRAGSDHIPAEGAIPTLKWTWGSAVIDRHTLTVPGAAVEGQRARLELLLYDHFTGRPLPILDPALAARGQTLSIWASGGLQ